MQSSEPRAEAAASQIDLARYDCPRVIFVGSESITAKCIERASGGVMADETAANRAIVTFTRIPPALEWMETQETERIVIVATDFECYAASSLLLIQQVASRFPRARVLLCTDSREQAEQALHHGAFSVLREPASRREFRHSLLRTMFAPDESSLSDSVPAESRHAVDGTSARCY